jgi:hypothetical protein
MTTPWVTSTSYSVGDCVTNETPTRTFFCKSAHTSGTFATDLAAGKWAIAFESLTAAQQGCVLGYAASARAFYRAYMALVRSAQPLVARFASDNTQFNTDMYMAELLPLAANLSDCAKQISTNDCYNAELAALTIIANAVSAKGDFRKMIGASECAELGA